MNGVSIRKSLNLISWEAAVGVVRDWESGNGERPISVRDAADEYIEDCEVRGLSDSTVRKFRVLLDRLVEFADKAGIRTVSGFGVDDLRKFRRSWKDSPVSAQKNLERLKSFFRFCKESNWSSDPAKVLRPPKVKRNATHPFTQDEVEKILKAVVDYPTKNSFGFDNRARMRAFVLLLLHTGLRIRDAVTLRAERLSNDGLHIDTSKTGTPVRVPLPPNVIKALRDVQRGDYFFWSGTSDEKAAVGNWQRSLRRLFALAEVKGHAHKFRHTLACRLLSNDVSVENVAAILGNSPAIVLKHYSPWVKSRQVALDAAMKRLW